MSATSTEHSRRAVYSAATRVFDDLASQKHVMDFWESNFSNDAIFHVANFTAKLIEHVGLTSEQRRVLMVSIFSALSKSESELAPVPVMLRADNQDVSNDRGIATPLDSKRSTKPAATRNSANVVFSAVMAGMIATVAAKQNKIRGELSQVIPDALLEAKVSSAVLRQFDRWVESGFEVEAVPVLKNNQDMSTALNATYVAVCNVAGPVVADRALAKAVAEAETLPEENEFPAASLL